MCHHSQSRSTIGEALIALTALGGFLYAFSQGMIGFEDVWAYALFLAVIVLFYFALLVARMLFTLVTGGDHAASWLEEHHERMHRDMQKKK